MNLSPQIKFSKLKCTKKIRNFVCCRGAKISEFIHKESHHPWAMVRENCSVITAYCTCMAGLNVQKNLQFSKLNWKTQSEGKKWKVLKFLNLPSFNGEETAKLKEVCPNAVITSQLNILSSTDTASEDFEGEMPPNVIKAVKMVSGSKNMRHKSMEIFSAEKCNILEQNTTEEYLCLLCFGHRRRLFTSSNFKTMLHRKQWSQDFITNKVHKSMMYQVCP